MQSHCALRTVELVPTRACSSKHSSCVGLHCDGGLNICKEAWIAYDKDEERALGAPALKVLKTTGKNFDYIQQIRILVQSYSLFAMLLLPKLVSPFRRVRGGWNLEGLALLPPPGSQASGTGTDSHVLGRASVPHLLLPWWDSLWSWPRLAGAEAVAILDAHLLQETNVVGGGGHHLTCPEAQEISQITSCWQLSPPSPPSLDAGLCVSCLHTCPRGGASMVQLCSQSLDGH